MNDLNGLEFIRTYFDELFNRRNIDALDIYLHEEYFDDDIGDPALDHIQSSKEFLADLFQRNPTIGVEVIDAITHENVISAFLEWSVQENGQKRVIRKGVAIFVIDDRKIRKRHTFLYFEG